MAAVQPSGGVVQPAVKPGVDGESASRPGTAVSVVPTPPPSDHAVGAKQHASRLRRHGYLLVPLAITLLWTIVVTALDEFDRVRMHWEASLTMVGGSFLAGSSPEGGGAVAFPIFTKVLHITAPVARTFSLCIQAVGMTSGSVIILWKRRPLDVKVVAIATPASIVGMVVSLYTWGQPGDVFWPSHTRPVVIKIVFSTVLASMSFAMVMLLLERGQQPQPPCVPVWNHRVYAGLVIAGLVGGALSAFIGTGANVTVFLFTVVMAGLGPKSGVPTSILVMTCASIAGLVVLGVVDGQFALSLDATGTHVTEVGGATVDDLPASRYDVLGLWLAAVPVVVWGAPLGTFVVHWLQEERVVLLVAALAAVEVVSTFVLLEEMHEDKWLIIGAVAGVTGSMVAVWLARRCRFVLLQLPLPPPQPKAHNMDGRLPVVADGGGDSGAGVGATGGSSAEAAVAVAVASQQQQHHHHHHHHHQQQKQHHQQQHHQHHQHHHHQHHHGVATAV